jgi:hypothetical protein
MFANVWLDPDTGIPLRQFNEGACFMLRTVSVAAIGVAMLGVSALPASAAPSSHPKTHTFTLPAVTGLKTWGSYYTASGKAHITACVKETASNVDLASVVLTAMNASITRHQSLAVQILGHSGKQVCKSLVTTDTAHLYGIATSGTTDGKVHIGKLKKFY